MVLDEWQLNNIIKAAAEEAVKAYIRMTDPTKDELTERQAYRMFGEGWVNHLVSTGTVKPRRKGVHKTSPKIYSRHELEGLKYGVNPLLKAVCNND